MPWTAKDAGRHTKKARSAVRKRQWAHVAESMRKQGYSEGRAIRAANSTVKRTVRKHRRSKGRRGRS